MAWHTPRDWTTGELVTEAMLDEQIKDNWNATFPLGPDAWTSYTPTDVSVTVGNGTRLARYQRIGRVIHFMWDLTFGSTTSFSGTVSVGIPVAAAATGRWVIGAFLLDSGTQTYGWGGIIQASGTSATPTAAAGGGVNATTPFTWTTNDRLTVSGTYEAAS